MIADIVFYNGHVITVDDKFNIASALAIKDDTIVKIGNISDIENMISVKTQVIDLKDRVLLPGFIDSHVHFTQTGLDEMALDARDFSNLDDFYEGLRQYAVGFQQDDWVISTAFDESKVKEKKLPDRWELDRLGVNNPIFISRVDAHSCIVNTRGYELLGIDEDTKGVDKNPGGVATGIFRAGANGLARNKIADFISDERRKGALYLAAQKALRAGVTFINALEGGALFSDRDVEVLKREKQSLPINLAIFHQTIDVTRVIKEGFCRIGGCITLDGSVGSYTAAFKEPYNDRPRSRGYLYYSDDDVVNFVKHAHRNGLQISTHCIGDMAIEQMIKAYERSLAAYPRRDHRHRIEHFSIPTLDQIKRAAELGLVISTQPVFDYYDNGTMYIQRLGEKRAKRAFPLKTMLKYGILVAGGSDSPVTPINPILGIHSAVNHSNLEERLTVTEAIKLFTINGAKAVFEEKNRGSLEEGKKADMVVLGEDPLTVPKEKIKDITVEMTLVGGKIRYRREETML